jgi:SpoVK/Ycf46/Vps4 family AAA+-type ATPase
MPKQLYIPLPCAAARKSMIERQLGPVSGVRSALSDADICKIVEKTAGYSGMHLP